MTTRERFVKVLTGQKVDRVPFMKIFGGKNAILPVWEKEYPGISNCIDDLLQFEGQYRGWQVTPVNTTFSRLNEEKIIEENETRVLLKDGIGRTVLSLKQKDADFHSSYINWPVKTGNDWERFKDRYLQPEDPERFPKNWKELAAQYQTRDYPLQLTHGGVYGFARNIMGDQALALAFYDTPDLVRDIMTTYTEMAIAVWEKMARAVDFDLIECWEDMASKNGSLISPATFREFLKPHYLRIADFAKKHGIKIILVDSDGQIEGLTKLMVESGVNTMYPYEVQAGNDVAKVLDSFPDLGVIGGLNKNVMAQGKKAIDLEMKKAQQLIAKGRYIPGPDHFVLSDVSFADYRYFMERLREIVMSTKPGN